LLCFLNSFISQQLGETALTLACRKSKTSFPIAKLLVEIGRANVNIAGAVTIHSLHHLHLIALTDNTHHQSLTNHNSQLTTLNFNDANIQDGMTALMWAAWNNDENLLRYLLQQGANVNSKSEVMLLRHLLFF
jgi:ankyrin repeat protein